MKAISRRGFLSLLSCVGAAVGVAGWSPRLVRAAGAPDSVPPLLAPVIRTLFPHRDLNDAFYSRMADAVWSQIGADRGLLRDGLARLDSAVGPRGWLNADDVARSRAVQGIGSEPFFQTLRSASIANVYRDPELWDRIGYGGNALAQGGYLQSFDDIDWLPVRT